MTNMNNYSDESQDMDVVAAPQEESFITYIKPVHVGDGFGYAVCTEDGAQLAIFATQEAAFYSARQFNLTPMVLH